MKKTLFTLVTCVCVYFLCSAVASANTVGVGLSATLASATSVSVVATEINSHLNTNPADDTWGTPVTISSGATTNGTLNFNGHSMVEDSTYHFFSTGYYYAIEVAPVAGGWAGPTAISYTAGANDIGQHATVAFAKCIYNPVAPTHPNEVDLSASTPMTTKYSLNSLPASLRSIPVSTITGGWLRMYLGIASDSTVSGVTPFTAASPAGTFTGTLTISYTGA